MSKISGFEFREPTHDERLVIKMFDKRKKLHSLLLILVSAFAVFISFALYSGISRRHGFLRYLPFLIAALVILFTVICLKREFSHKAYEDSDVELVDIKEITTDSGVSELAVIKQGNNSLKDVSIFGAIPKPGEPVVLIAKDRQEFSCFIIRKENDQ